MRARDPGHWHRALPALKDATPARLQHRLPYLRPVDRGLHTERRRGWHWCAASGGRALPAGCTPDGRPEGGCGPRGPGLPVIPLDLVVHGLVRLVFALLSGVVCLLGLVEGWLGCRPGDVLLVYHRDGNVAPGELVTAQAAPARGGGQAGRGGGRGAVRGRWRLGPLRDTEHRHTAL